MANKTEPVKDLVRVVLKTMKEPYGEDVIEDVCVAIENNTEWMRRYELLCHELKKKSTVNQMIGWYTKDLTGMHTIEEVPATRATIIGSYSKLTYDPKAGS